MRTGHNNRNSNSSIVHNSTQNVIYQVADVNDQSMNAAGSTYQPVVVLKPLAREGRGFRGLGAPDDVTGMSAGAAHASPRGRSLVPWRTLKWADLLNSCSVGTQERFSCRQFSGAEAAIC